MTTHRDRRARMGGQTLVMFAVVLAFLFVGLLALIADLGAVFTAYTRADNVALLAAQAGASQIDRNEFYGGRILLDLNDAPRQCNAAISAAIEAGNLPKPIASCTLNAARTAVTADIQFSAQMPMPIPGTRAPVHATQTAQVIYGDTTGKEPQP
jgi:hypothetical protein